MLVLLQSYRPFLIKIKGHEAIIKHVAVFNIELRPTTLFLYLTLNSNVSMYNHKCIFRDKKQKICISVLYLDCLMEKS